MTYNVFGGTLNPAQPNTTKVVKTAEYIKTDNRLLQTVVTS